MTHPTTADEVARHRRLSTAELVKADLLDAWAFDEQVALEAQSRPAARPRTLTKAEQTTATLAASEAARTAVAALRAELAVVKADLATVTTVKPVPVMVRGTPRPDRSAEARDYRAMADNIRRDDPVAAQGYRDLANDLLRKG